MCQLELPPYAMGTRIQHRTTHDPRPRTRDCATHDLPAANTHGQARAAPSPTRKREQHGHRATRGVATRLGGGLDVPDWDPGGATVRQGDPHPTASNLENGALHSASLDLDAGALGNGPVGHTRAHSGHRERSAFHARKQPTVAVRDSLAAARARLRLGSAHPACDGNGAWGVTLADAVAAAAGAAAGAAGAGVESTALISVPLGAASDALGAAPSSPPWSRLLNHPPIGQLRQTSSRDARR